jgi:segregation and condensation protein A
MNEPTATSELDLRGAPCSVRLQAFQGPLELLLHLIRTGEIDIAEIPITEIAHQYDSYLSRMKGINLEAAGEYLLIASTLTHLKSRRLLPSDPAQADEAEDEYGLDDLVSPGSQPMLRRAAEHLQEREAAMELIYRRPTGRVSEYTEEQGIEADLFSLVRALQAVLGRMKEAVASRISRERMSLVDRLNWLVETLNQKRRISFGDLFEDLPDRLTCILTFLALLEVIRLQLARAYTSHRQQEIWIVLVEGPPAPRTAAPTEPNSDA